MKFGLRIILVFLVLIVFFGGLPLLGQELQDIQTVKVVIKQSYKDAPKVSLPLKDIIKKWLQYASITIVPEDATEYDATLTVKVNGEALAGNYTSGKLYSGVLVNGFIQLEDLQGQAIETRVRYKKEPPQTATDNLKTPDKAPFEDALGEINFRLAIVMTKAFGIQPVLQALEDQDKNLRAGAILCLGNTRDPRYLELLLHKLSDTSYNVHLATVTALDTIDQQWRESELIKKTFPQFIEALQSNDPFVRETAAWILRELKDPRAIEPLVQALGDVDRSVRLAVKYALDTIDLEWRNREEIKKMIPQFIEALRNELSDIRAGAAYALGELKDQKTMELLIHALGDVDEEVRRNIASALDDIDPQWRESAPIKKMIPQFIEALKDIDPDNWLVAKEVLKEVTGEDFGDDYDSWLRWWNEESKK